MKCRARMIDGSPVTFNSYDLGLQTYREEDDNILSVRHRVTEFVGEGFYVLSRVPSDYGLNLRAVRDEFALKRSGVDTATVEYWESNFWVEERKPEWHGTVLKSRGRLGGWVPLFPPVIKPLTTADIIDGDMEAYWNRHSSTRLREQAAVLYPPPKKSATAIAVQNRDGEVVGLFRDDEYHKARAAMGEGYHMTLLGPKNTAPVEPSRDMLVAGGAKLHDVLHTSATLVNGRIELKDGYGDALKSIWRAMEKARKP